jgi:predicted phage-related endonuclease
MENSRTTTTPSSKEEHPLEKLGGTVRAKYRGPRPVEGGWERDGKKLCVGPHVRKKQGLGSYDATVIMGLSPYKSPLGLYYEIRGEIPKPPTKFEKLARIGTLLEPVVCQLYIDETRRTLIDRAEYRDDGSRWDIRRHPEIEWMVAALDMEIKDPGLDADAQRLDFPAKGNGSLEIKTKDPWAEFFDEDGNPPLEVMVQHQHQLAVGGFEWGSIAVLMGRRFYFVDLRRDDDFIKLLIEEEKEFWERCWNGDPPEPDSSEATSNAIQERRPESKVSKIIDLPEDLSKSVLERYVLLEGAMAEAKDELELLKNKIKLAMDDAERAFVPEALVPAGTDRLGWSYLTIKEGSPSWSIPANGRTDEEVAALEEMGAIYKKGKKSYRKFERLGTKGKKNKKEG